MTARPKLILTLRFADKLLEVLGIVTLLILWGLPLSYFANLPETIPVHYDQGGHVDGYGGKLSLFILPMIGTLLFTALTLLNRFPHIFNYPVSIAESNAETQYTKATRIVRYLKWLTLLLFLYNVYNTMQNATVHTTGLGVWFLPFTLALIFIPIAYFIYDAVRAK